MCIEVYLEYSENLIGICRVESAISYDHGNKIKDYQELVDNHGFNYSDGEDSSREIVDYVAEETKLDKSLIHIMD